MSINMQVFRLGIYDMMLEYDECWVMGLEGRAMIVSDASLMDC